MEFNSGFKGLKLEDISASLQKGFRSSKSDRTVLLKTKER